jgi:hypothetical protein
MSSEKRLDVKNPPSKKQLIFLSWTKDILIYTIVLNLFVEFNQKIVIDSFTISIFTAIVLKILLEVILKLEHKVGAAFKGYKVLRIIITWLILFGSKFLILEVIDLIFGDHVHLGKFLDVILLVIVMMVTREVFQQIFRSLGNREDKPV